MGCGVVGCGVVGGCGVVRGNDFFVPWEGVGCLVVVRVLGFFLVYFEDGMNLALNFVRRMCRMSSGFPIRRQWWDVMGHFACVIC